MLVAEYKPGRDLQTDVEFYSALLLHGLGLPTELFTPTFAVGRVAGWTGHCMEQRGQDREQERGAVAPAAHLSFSVWPAIRICGSTSGFSARISATGTPVLWAIAVRVSPLSTV